MPYNTTLAAAVASAGTIDATDTSPQARPTQTQLTTMWNQAAIDIEARLGGCKISIPTSPSSKALEWAQMVETLLTSGKGLQNRGSVGSDGEANAGDLLEDAEARLAWACTEAGKDWLLSNGASDSAGGGTGFARSHWTSGSYPSGYEAPDYVEPRAFEDDVQW